jgi:hypothetical protein
MKKICYVTSFLDIGRGEWANCWTRKASEYIECFLRHLELFKGVTTHEFFIYIDKKYANDLRNCIGEDYPSVYLIPIDEDFLHTYSLLWRRLGKETEIIHSNSYKELVSHRLHFPENSQPKYTMINNVKIDLVVHTMNMSDADVFGWIDFGYIKNDDVKPKKLLDWRKLDLERMNFSLISHLQDHHLDIIRTLKWPEDVIEGGFFFSTRDVLLRYRNLFHDVHKMFHDMGIVDDDQHIVLQCYKREPELFKMHHQGGWLKSLKVFQLD